MGRARPRLSFSACLGSQVHVRFGGMCCKTILSIRTRNIETRFYFSWVEMLVNVVLSWPLPRGRLIQKDQQPAKAIPPEIILPVQIVDTTNYSEWNLPFEARACPTWQNVTGQSRPRLREGASKADWVMLGNLLRDPNRLLGSGFCRSRCWLGYHNRIGNRLRNIDGFRAGLMSTNHAQPP
jgi:hypothetical protein